MTLPAMTIKVPENPQAEEWEDESEDEWEDKSEDISSHTDEPGVSIFYEPSENQLITDLEQDIQPDDPIDFTPAVPKAEKPSTQLDSTKVVQTKENIEGPVQAGVMYLRQTLRSGQTVSHKGHLVIIGDVNPGAEVVAEGDITVWGALRGIARAGVGGNNDAEIRALRLQPIQIRIGEAFARSPDRNRLHYDAHNGPEAARIVDGKIKVFKFSPQ